MKVFVLYAYNFLFYVLKLHRKNTYHFYPEYMVSYIHDLKKEKNFMFHFVIRISNIEKIIRSYESVDKEIYNKKSFMFCFFGCNCLFCIFL